MKGPDLSPIAEKIRSHFEQFGSIDEVVSSFSDHRRVRLPSKLGLNCFWTCHDDVY